MAYLGDFIEATETIDNYFFPQNNDVRFVIQVTCHTPYSGTIDETADHLHISIEDFMTHVNKDS